MKKWIVVLSLSLFLFIPFSSVSAAIGDSWSGGRTVEVPPLSTVAIQFDGISDNWGNSNYGFCWWYSGSYIIYDDDHDTILYESSGNHYARDYAIKQGDIVEFINDTEETITIPSAKNWGSLGTQTEISPKMEPVVVALEGLPAVIIQNLQDGGLLSLGSTILAILLGVSLVVRLKRLFLR